jgi:hypothetical protein
LTANRKLDRPAVAKLVTESAPLVSTPDAPSNEDLTLRVWRQALDRPELRPDENVVELGSHSLLAIQVALSLGDILDRRVPIRFVLGATRPGALASSLRTAEEDGQLERRLTIPRRRASPALDRATEASPPSSRG